MSLSEQTHLKFADEFLRTDPCESIISKMLIHKFWCRLQGSDKPQKNSTLSLWCKYSYCIFCFSRYSTDLCFSVDIPWFNMSCSTISSLLRASLWWVLLLTGRLRATGIICKSLTHLQSAMLKIVWIAILCIRGVVSPDFVKSSGSKRSTLRAISAGDTLAKWTI